MSKSVLPQFNFFSIFIFYSDQIVHFLDTVKLHFRNCHFTASFQFQLNLLYSFLHCKKPILIKFSMKSFDFDTFFYLHCHNSLCVLSKNQIKTIDHLLQVTSSQKVAKRGDLRSTNNSQEGKGSQTFAQKWNRSGLYKIE